MAWAHAFAGLLLLAAPASTRAGARDPGPGLVRMVQQRLADRGFAPGYPDGRWGPQSEEAMREFQQANGIAGTGVPDSQTLAALWSTPPETVAVQPLAGHEEVAAPARRLDFGFGVGVGFLAAALLTAIGLWWRPARPPARE